MKKKVQYDWLDLIRGMAALAVFTGHLRIICYRDVAPGTLDLLGKIIFFLTGFGHISVIIFFVLSGFLIIKSIHQSVLQGRWDTVNYTESRFYRLWVVLIPCLFLGLLFDKIGLQYWGDSLFYSNKWKYFFDQDLANKLSAEIFIGNAFFVQKILVPTLGSNGALWSLANEFWYYVLFPLFYFAAKASVNVKYRLLFLVMGVSLLFFVGYQISINFPIWLMGGLSYIITLKVKDIHLQKKVGLLIALFFFLCAVCLLRLKIHEELFNNYTVAFLFAIAIPFLINIEMKNHLLQQISTYFSNISYTLYLAHLPFIYLVTSIIHFQDETWSKNNFWTFASLTVATILYSTILWFLFERNTKKIRDYIAAKYKS